MAPTIVFFKSQEHDDLASLPSSMTRVIRNCEGFYFKSGGEWTMIFEEAQKFSDIQSAVAVSYQFHLSSIDLVLVVNDKPSQEWDVVLPLTGWLSPNLESPCRKTL